MSIKQKLMNALKFIGAAAAFAIIVPFVGAKASADTVGDFTVTGGTQGTDYKYENNVLTILTETPITIENTDKYRSTIDDRISVAYNVNANITLAGVNIYQGVSAAIDAGNGNVTITLADGSKNYLQGGTFCAGLQTSGSLVINGPGSLEAKGGARGSGIGGGKNGSGGNITINGGRVTAEGGAGGAGIGGGKNGSGDNITINGGIVTATGGSGGAGIGGGDSGDGGNIIINGDSVWATAGADANNIGGGKGKDAVTPKNGDGNDVYLCRIFTKGKKVTIDGKEYPNHYEIDLIQNISTLAYITGETHIVTVGDKFYLYTFSDGNFTADEKPLKISGDNLQYNTDYTYENNVLTIKSDKAITIENADKSTSTTDRIDVASGVNANITLNGVNIDVSTQNDTAAFKIADNSTGNVTIMLADGSKNYLKSGNSCAGLQTAAGSLEIKGAGSLEATGGSGGAGIGGGFTNDGKKITISGGTVTATGGSFAAGIGGGRGGSGSNITIKNGIVIATGNSEAAGIGGGNDCSGKNITISGGTVTATGGMLGSGIGGGKNGSGGNITINGGSVNATAGKSGNAIGGGCKYNYQQGDSVTPTNGTANVYLCKIPNPNSEKITIDGNEYTPVNHAAADPADTTLYAYLTGTNHTVTVGSTKYNCTFDSTTNTFTLTPVTNPSKPSGGNNRPTKPEITDYPIFDGKETTWSNIEKIISELDEGEEIEVTLNGSTAVPSDVIKSIKDSKAVVKFKITSAFSRTIDGSKLTDSDIMDYDFDISFVSAKGVETLRGIIGTGFAIENITDKAILNISFKSNHAGKFANLYKSVDGKLIFADNVKIDENGNATGLAVYEKGEYVVMLSTLSDRAGDIDNDGILTAKDALAALKHFAKLENGANPVVGDMNGDGVINAKDALIILKKYAGIAG